MSINNDGELPQHYFVFSFSSYCWKPCISALGILA